MKPVKLALLSAILVVSLVVVSCGPSRVAVRSVPDRPYYGGYYGPGYYGPDYYGPSYYGRPYYRYRRPPVIITPPPVIVQRPRYVVPGPRYRDNGGYRRSAPNNGNAPGNRGRGRGPF